jgi:integrase/recombinase XerD
MVAMFGLLGLRIFEACHANVTDLSEERGHRVLKVYGKGGKTVLVPLPSATPGEYEGLGRFPAAPTRGRK